MQVLRIFIFQAVCAAAMACWTGSAAAQLVISGNFYEESSAGGCTNGNCFLNFSATPSTGPLVLVSKINCLLANFPADVLFIYFGLRDTPSGTARRIEYLPVPAPQLTSQQLRFYSFTVPSDFLFGNGKVPMIAVSVSTTGASTSMNCKITGRLQQG